MTARGLALATLIAVAIALPSLAEAAPRRPHRRLPFRFGGASATPIAVKSDEQVRAAIARTPTGGVADLPQGMFRTAVVLDRPMTLRAHALGTTFDGRGLGVPVVTVAAGVEGVAIERLRIQDGDVEGILGQAGAHELRLTQVVVTSCGGDAVRLEGVARARLDLCALDSNGGDALDADGTDLEARRVTARWNGGAAVLLRGTGARVTELAVVGGPVGVAFLGSAGVAERCRFADTGTAVRFATGSWGNRVVTCAVTGGSTAVEAAEGSSSATVAGVLAERQAGDGIRMLGSSHLVADCAVVDAGRDGVVLSGTGSRVASSEVRRVRGEGIRVEGDGHAVADDLVAGAATEGIHVAGGTGNEVTGNTVTGCGGRGIADDGVDTRMWRNRLE